MDCCRLWKRGRVRGAHEHTQTSSQSLKYVQLRLVSLTQTTTWTATHQLSGLEF